MKNIFYIHNFNSIGGTESFLYYLCKKYQDQDITVYYKTGDRNQIERLKKYVRTKKYNGEKIVCEKAFFNYVTDIIDNVEAKEYIQIIHTDYKEQELIFFKNKKINKYLGVSKVVCDSFKEYTGLDIELCYNPIIIDKPRKVLNLISATRLTAEKGRDRIVALGRLFDENNIPYLWTIFTDDVNKIKNPNIIYMKPRLDITDYIANADYLVQLSNKGEGYGYTPAEALTLGTPVIVTPCPAFLEIGVKDKENAFVLDYDLNNVPIQEIYKGLPKFEYKAKKDNYDKLLAKGENTYKKEMNKIVKVKSKKDYYDINFNRLINKGEIFEVNKIRAETLEENDVANIINE